MRADDSAAPGRALGPGDDAPAWIREEGGRVIAETGGVRLFVSRMRATEGDGLRFTFGGTSVWDSADGWRRRFAEHAVVILGSGLVAGRPHDRRGRFPLFGLTARSVARVELRYADGSPLRLDHPDGGFVLMADARRALAKVVVYDQAGRELERADVSAIGRR